MKQTYQIQGMSCGGCVTSVRQSLLKVEGVTEAEVQLNPPQAVVTSGKAIPVDKLQSQLNQAGPYTIREPA
jgi:copper chaperone